MKRSITLICYVCHDMNFNPQIEIVVILSIVNILIFIVDIKARKIVPVKLIFNTI